MAKHGPNNEVIKDSMNDSTHPIYVTIKLDDPVLRGDKTISEIQLRKPRSGELRGVSLMEVANLDVLALQRILPRITAPTLTAHEVANLDPADLMSIGAEVAYFLAKKADRNMVSPNL